MQTLFDLLSDIGTAVLIGLAGALLFELATVALRFGLGWTSPERTRPIARISRGWRIHHGYPGVLLLTLVPLMGMAPSDAMASAWLGGLILVVGITLALSDLIHHAIVLPLFVGAHEFDLRYPGH